MKVALKLKPFVTLAKRLEDTRTVEQIPKINGALSPVLDTLRGLTVDTTSFNEICTGDTLEAFRDAVEYVARYKVSQRDLTVASEETFPLMVVEVERLGKLEQNQADIEDLKRARRFIRRLRWNLNLA